MYYFPDPPYFLLAAGLFAALTSGVAFQASLKEKVHDWSKNRSTRSLAQMQTMELKLPFLGMTVSICIFLGAGLEIFGFPVKLAYAIAVPLTLLTAFLVWYQLKIVLYQLERGGSRALDLDIF